MNRKWRIGKWLPLIGLLMLTGCENTLETIREKLAGFLVPLTPRQEFLREVKRAGTLDTAQIRQWREAYTLALADSVVVELPQRLSLKYTPQAASTAASYRFRLPAGRLLTVRRVEAVPAVPVFGELFAVAYGATPDPRRAVAR